MGGGQRRGGKRQVAQSLLRRLSRSSIRRTRRVSVSAGLNGKQTNTGSQCSAISSADKRTPEASERRGRPNRPQTLFFSRKPRSILRSASWPEAFKCLRPLDTADMIHANISASNDEWIMGSMGGRINEAPRLAGTGRRTEARADSCTQRLRRAQISTKALRCPQTG